MIYLISLYVSILIIFEWYNNDYLKDFMLKFNVIKRWKLNIMYGLFFFYLIM